MIAMITQAVAQAARDREVTNMMHKRLLMWQYEGFRVSERQRWTEFDSYSLCRDLKIIAGDGKIDWVRIGMLMDVLDRDGLSSSEKSLKSFLRDVAQHKYAWWDGQRVRLSEYPHGRKAPVYWDFPAAAIK